MVKNRYYVCKTCGTVNYTSYCYSERNLCHCKRCEKDTPSEAIVNLEDKLEVKGNLRIVSEPILSFNKFTLIIEQFDSEISFKKSKTKFKEDKQFDSNIMENNAETLTKHNTQKKKNIITYKLEVDKSEEKYTNQIVLFKNERKLKGWKTRLKDLLSYFHRKDFLADIISDSNLNGYYINDNRYNYDALMKLIENPHMEILIKAGYCSRNSGIDLNDYCYNTAGTNPAEIFKISKSMCNFLKEMVNDPNGMYNAYGNFRSYLNAMQANPKIDLNIFKNVIMLLEENSTHLNFSNNYGYDSIYGNQTRDLSVDVIMNLIDVARVNKLNLKALIPYLTTKAREEQGMCSLLMNFKAYINMIKLGKELEIDIDKYPKSLLLAHDRLAYTRVIKADEINQKQFVIQRDNNKQFNYENDKYCMICPEELSDLKKEGDRLRNCIGTYVEKYVKGYSKVFFMRDIKDKDRALCAIELNQSNHVVQTKGFSNRYLTMEEDAFVKEWIENKVNKVIEETNKYQDAV